MYFVLFSVSEEIKVYLLDSLSCHKQIKQRTGERLDSGEMTLTVFRLCHWYHGGNVSMS
jgi:hypothetical protein